MLIEFIAIAALSTASAASSGSTEPSAESTPAQSATGTPRAEEPSTGTPDRAGEATLEPGAPAATDLAKKLANPISDLISIPFQFNYDTGFGPSDGDRLTLNIQPVIPFSISEDWNLITRTIIPLIQQESPAPGIDDEFALGDVLQSFFFSPKDPVEGWIIGAGPVVLWPTGTEPTLRSESLGLGPTLVALQQQSGFTYGMLVNHVWSVTQSDDKDEVNSTFLQPFVSYSWPTATTLTLNTESSYDWNSESWTVPLNLQVSQILKVGPLPVQFTVGGRWYAESPDGGPEWGLRFAFTILLPK